LPEVEFCEFFDIFNLIQGNIYEILVTTVSESGILNTAPFGVKFSSGEDTIFMKAYEGTTTLSNLQATGSCIINIVHDPLVFFTALRKGKTNRSSMLEEKAGEIIYTDTGFKRLRPVRGSHGYITAEVIKIVSDNDPNEVYLKAQKAYSLGSSVVFSRARASLIEMMIYLSRMDMYTGQKKKNSLLSSLNEHLIIVEKTGCESWIGLAKEIINIVIEFQDSNNHE